MTPSDRQQFRNGWLFGAGMALASLLMGFAWGLGNAAAQWLVNR